MLRLINYYSSDLYMLCLNSRVHYLFFALFVVVVISLIQPGCYVQGVSFPGGVALRNQRSESCACPGGVSIVRKIRSHAFGVACDAALFTPLPCINIHTRQWHAQAQWSQIHFVTFRLGNYKTRCNLSPPTPKPLPQSFSLFIKIMLVHSEKYIVVKI